jgi:hypothetical protein
MNKTLSIIVLATLLVGGAVGNMAARSGCCSHHHGVADCDEATGYWRCNDGTDSPSCRCKDGHDVGGPSKHRRRHKTVLITADGG